MSKKKLCYMVIVVLILLVTTMFSGSHDVLADDGDRAISITTTYTGITITSTQSATLPITLYNLGSVDEQVDINVTSFPDGWVVNLVNEESGAPYRIRSLYLTAEGEAQTIYFRARPPAGIQPGDYSFLIEGISQDTLVISSLNITIGIEEKPVSLGRVKLSTTYPDLSGKGSAGFEFKVDVTNEGSEDRTFSFSADAPPEWNVYFRPGYEQKQIASMGIKAGETKEITVELEPPKYVRPGSYTITVTSSSGNIEDSIDLTAVVLEEEEELTYDLEMLTPTGLLSTEVNAGKQSQLSILVTNRGSGEQTNVNLLSTKPEDWDVAFTPDKIDTLLPGQTREVRATITPPSKTIAGDYSVTLRTSGYKASDRLEIRVTVGASTTWGWIGLAIVLAVIAGTGVLFWRLGRR